MYFKNGAYILGSLCSLPSLVSAPLLPVKQHPYFLLGSSILPSSSSAWFGGIVPRPCLKQRSPQHSGQGQGDKRRRILLEGFQQKLEQSHTFFLWQGSRAWEACRWHGLFQPRGDYQVFRGAMWSLRRAGPGLGDPELLLTSDSSGLFSYRNQNTTLAWSFL